MLWCALVCRVCVHSDHPESQLDLCVYVEGMIQREADGVAIVEIWSPCATIKPKTRKWEREVPRLWEKNRKTNQTPNVSPFYATPHHILLIIIQRWQCHFGSTTLYFNERRWGSETMDFLYSENFIHSSTITITTNHTSFHADSC